MAILQFPVNPILGQEYIANGIIYEWDGDSWLNKFESQTPEGIVQAIVDANADGTGSNLDADFLDGQNSSYYLDWNNTTNRPSPALTLTGDVTGTATFTSMNSATLNVTVVDDSHNHIISNVDGLQAALDSKQAASTALTTSTAFGGDVSGTYNSIVVADNSHNHTGLLKRADIPGSADLNTYTTDGYYHQNANANASSGTNYPIALAGMLTVTSDGVMVYQTYQTYNSSGVYVRSYYNGTWYAWERLYDVSYHPDADKWTTARTLSLTGDATGSTTWDGSANASIAVTIVNDSHDHDGRYYTETEADSRFVNATGDTMTGTLTISGTSAQIKLNDTDGADFYLHANSNNFYILPDRDSSGAWETPYALQLEADTNIGYLFSNRIFADNYHPNADKLTTARTISLSGDVSGSVSFDGSANVSITATVADDSHNHTWNNIDGGSVNTWGGLRHSTANGYIDFGPANASYAHIYTGSPAFYMNKGIFSTGDVTAFASDARLKKDIIPIKNAVERVKNLKGVYYHWNEIAHELAGYDMDVTNVGVLAQDVKTSLPEAVAPAPFDHPDGESASGQNYMTVKYEKLVPLLIEAIKEQQQQIDALKAELQKR